MANIIAIAPQEKIFQHTIDFYMLTENSKNLLEKKLNCADWPCYSSVSGVNMEDFSIHGVPIGDTKIGSYTSSYQPDDDTHGLANWVFYAKGQPEIMAYEKKAHGEFLTTQENMEYLAMYGYIFWLSKLWAGDGQVLYNWSHA